MTKNKDGFEAGGLVSNDDLYLYLAKQRQKKVEAPKRGRPPKGDVE